MEAAILQACKDVEYHLKLHFSPERRTNADFWACKGALRAAVTGYDTKIQPKLHERRIGTAADAAMSPQVDEACIALLVQIADAALSLKDATLAVNLLKRALELARGSAQETLVSETMQKAADQYKATHRPGPWG